MSSTPIASYRAGIANAVYHATGRRTRPRPVTIDPLL
jgi:CO/xanthine dehydrogenase Mo-binding subunit